MMFKTVDLLLVGFILTCFTIKPSKCQPNRTIQPNEPRCLTYLDEVVQMLSSKIPPIKDSRMTDNYYNISRALYPSIDLPALYVRVTIQFLKDYQNGTKIIDDHYKLTWSTSCTYVSVNHITLFAMTVFSLATIYPQRRETELTITVLPLCKDSPYKQDDEARTSKMWRYIVSTLEDIAVNSKTSDPRINTVACVVEGHEYDKGQPIKYPKDSGPKVIIWDYCWLVFTASIVTSLVVWVYLRNWLKDAMENKDRLRILAGTILKMTTPTLIITVLIFSLAFIIHIATYEFHCIPYVIAYLIFLFPFSLVIMFLRYYCCNVETNASKIEDCCYKFRFRFLLPVLFITTHHFLWVLCGIISEPYWATPIFLMECLLGFSIMYSLYLYEKDVVCSQTPIIEGKIWIILHLGMAVAAFTLILLVVVFVGHGHIVNVTDAGVIQVIITVTLMWLIKNSGLHLKSFKKSTDQRDGTEMQPLNTA